MTNKQPMMDLVTQLQAYEDGLLDQEETIELFKELISSGLISELQGHYGRTAQRFLDSGLISFPRRVFGERIS